MSSFNSKKAIAQYLEECGSTCFCRESTSIEREIYDWYAPQDHQPEVIMKCKCAVCGMEWSETYQLSGVNIT
jgi:hypothetical protein